MLSPSSSTMQDTDFNFKLTQDANFTFNFNGSWNSYLNWFTGTNVSNYLPSLTQAQLHTFFKRWLVLDETNSGYKDSRAQILSRLLGRLLTDQLNLLAQLADENNVPGSFLANLLAYCSVNTLNPAIITGLPGQAFRNTLGQIPAVLPLLSSATLNRLGTLALNTDDAHTFSKAQLQTLSPQALIDYFSPWVFAASNSPMQMNRLKMLAWNHLKYDQKEALSKIASRDSTGVSKSFLDRLKEHMTSGYSLINTQGNPHSEYAFTCNLDWTNYSSKRGVMTRDVLRSLTDVNNDDPNSNLSGFFVRWLQPDNESSTVGYEDNRSRILSGLLWDLTAAQLSELSTFKVTHISGISKEAGGFLAGLISRCSISNLNAGTISGIPGTSYVGLSHTVLSQITPGALYRLGRQSFIQAVSYGNSQYSFSLSQLHSLSGIHLLNYCMGWMKGPNFIKITSTVMGQDAVNKIHNYLWKNLTIEQKLDLLKQKIPSEDHHSAGGENALYALAFIATALSYPAYSGRNTVISNFLNSILLPQFQAISRKDLLLGEHIEGILSLLNKARVQALTAEHIAHLTTVHLNGGLHVDWFNPEQCSILSGQQLYSLPISFFQDLTQTQFNSLQEEALNSLSDTQVTTLQNNNRLSGVSRRLQSRNTLHPGTSNTPLLIHTPDGNIGANEKNKNVSITVHLEGTPAREGDTIELLIENISFYPAIKHTLTQSEVKSKQTNITVPANTNWGSDGTKTLAIRILDKAENPSPISSSISFILDATLPILSISASKEGHVQIIIDLGEINTTENDHIEIKADDLVCAHASLTQTKQHSISIDLAVNTQWLGKTLSAQLITSNGGRLSIGNHVIATLNHINNVTGEWLESLAKIPGVMHSLSGSFLEELPDSILASVGKHFIHAIKPSTLANLKKDSRLIATIRDRFFQDKNILFTANQFQAMTRDQLEQYLSSWVTIKPNGVTQHNIPPEILDLLDPTQCCKFDE